MANGNQELDFNKFLSTLISASQANERLNVQKDSLALQETSTTSQSNYRDYLIENSKAEGRRQDFELEAAALSQYPELQKDWLKNQPFIKKNPEYGARIDTAFKARTELDDRINAAAAMPPGPRQEEYRKIRLNTNLNPVQRDYIDTGLVRAREEATVSGEEIEAQPAYRYYLAAQGKFKEISEAGRARDPVNTTNFIETEAEFQARRANARDNMFHFEQEAFDQEAAGRGKYPGLSIPFNEQFPYEQFPDEIMYDNIEDPLLEKEVDETISFLGGPAIESAVLPPEFSPPTRPNIPPQMDTVDSLEVPADVEAIPPEEAGAFMPAKDYSSISSEDMEKYGTQVFFDKGTNQWYDKRTMKPATISQIKKFKGRSKPKELNVDQQKSINRALKQIAQLEKTTIDKDTLGGKINRLKKKILNIDPNYKFKN